MLSLHLGLRRQVRPAAIVGFSGSAGRARRRPGEIPPILLTHGDSDTVIPPQAMFLAASQLGLAGAAVQWHLAPRHGTWHRPGRADDGGRFPRLAFRGLLKSQGEIRSVYKPS